MYSDATRPRSRWWWVLGLLLVLLVLRQTRPGQPATDVGTRAVDTTLRPARVALSATGGWLADTWGNLTHLRSLNRRSHALEGELARNQSQAAQLVELRAEVTRLRRLADLRQALDRPSVSARAIGRSPSPWFRTLTLNVGARRGVQTGCAVVAPEGLVGQVYQVAAGTCRVLCVVDRLGSAGVRLQPPPARSVVGVARGDGNNLCTLAYDGLEAKVNAGDVVVTSGQEAGSLFPAGLVVGRVAKVEKRPHESSMRLTIQPAVLPEQVEEVSILLPEPEDTRP
ncbi:MAG: rod shape-determining protein MreC [Armatimonadetes bacterium]|nr:rod shape-determining protein MreC [Armatimonadota bacterium]